MPVDIMVSFPPSPSVISYWLLCYELNVYLQNSYIEILTTRVAPFEDGAFKKIRVACGHKVGP